VTKVSSSVLSLISEVFDRLYTFWEHAVVKKYMGPGMVLIYAGYLVVIEFNLRGMLPERLAEKVFGLEKPVRRPS